MRRSLGGGHFDALGCGHFDMLGTAIATCALRHRASGTMKFAKLTPCLEDLLHLVVARMAPRVVDKLHGFLVWKIKVEPEPLKPLQQARELKYFC